MTPDQVRAIVREMIDVVHAADVVQAAEAKNAAAGILNGPHPANKAASVGLVQVMLARALDQTGVDLSDYELQLVKK
jgi:hypothetical protein